MTAKKSKTTDSALENQTTATEPESAQSSDSALEEQARAAQPENAADENIRAAEADTGPESSVNPDKDTADAAKDAAAKAGEKAREKAAAAKERIKNIFTADRLNPTFMTGLLDIAVKRLSSASACDCLYSNIPKVLGLGHLALLCLAVLSLVAGVALGIRAGSGAFVAYGVAAALLLLAAQYAAVKSFTLLSDIIENHPSRISGPAITELLAFLQLVCALCGIFLIISGIAHGFIFTDIAYGIFVLVILFLMAGLIFHADKHLNVRYDPEITLAGQVLAVLSLFSKALVKLAPYIYAVGTVVMGVLAIPPLIMLLARGQSAWGSALQAGCLLASAAAFALAPVILYFSVMLTYLLIDLLKSILGRDK
jgi:hypothetical protein